MNNDLISREDLKKKLTPLKLYGNVYCKAITEKNIDNAPTVNYPFYQEAYQTGYEEGQNDRPQGEWIIIKDERWGDNVKCPFCGKELAGTDLNFCCKCGADMRGGKE